jgi:hypothetical protein
MTEWTDLVKKVMKENPALSFKECLIKAKKLYKKPSGVKKSSKKQTKKGKKSTKGTKKSKKGKKSKK